MSSPFHILVVDDQPSIRLMLESGLSLSGFRVSCARNGTEAVMAASSKKFDAVISDIYMPDGDGLALLSALKHLDPPPLVGMLTHYPLEAYRKRCLALGADYFWDKSKDLAAIPAAFRELARRPGRS